MHKMRRSDRKLPYKKAIEILEKGEYGVLATAGKDNQAYGVPLNYVYADDSIYFHAALSGHKLENIVNNPKVSFTVVGETILKPLEMTTLYESVIVFGKAELVDEKEKLKALRALVIKYAPKFIETGEEHIKKSSKACVIIKLKIESISGKGKYQI